MVYNPQDIEYLREQMKMLFKIKSDLEAKFPGRRFAIDGHLLGSAGEVLAAYHYNLDLFQSSAKAHDAQTSDGRQVQIKATQGNRIAMGSAPDHLIVLWIDMSAGEAQEVYNGPGAQVWSACGILSSNGTRSIYLSKLREFSNGVEKSQRIEPRVPIERY